MILQSIAAFIAITFTLIILHELGHYLTARAFGLKPQAFSVGMGPEIIGANDKNGTRWRLAVFPLGGYVKFHGEMHPGTNSEDADHPDSFAKLARWKRALVIAAGPLTNILVTVVIFAAIGLAIGRPEVGGKILSVMPDSAAHSAGLRPNDQVVSWNGKSVDGTQNLIRFIRVSPERKLDLEIRRGNENIQVPVTIRRTNIKDQFGNELTLGALGVEFERKMVTSDNPVQAVAHAGSEAINLFKLQAKAIGQVLTGERSTKEISGPIRMAKMSGEQASLGWLPVIYFTAMISIAIAFMNLLPIPGLDGGYLAIYGIESLAGNDLSQKAMANVTRGGYAVLGMLMIFAFSNDIRTLLLS